MDRNFILFHSSSIFHKNYQESLLFYSNDGGININPIDIKINNISISINRISSTSNYFLLVSYHSSVFVYMDKNGQLFNEHNFDKSLQILVHPVFPNYMLANNYDSLVSFKYFYIGLISNRYTLK